ncbi:MAG TPA: LysR family transcriptional regulator, partial [Dongiaceae bacterium]
MDWDKLRIFHAVAEAGSFTHAGETLNLSQSAVSRQISSLEESLNVSLFHRHARGLILTEQGELLYRTSHEVFSKLAMAEAQLAESKDRPKGQLKVTATQAFGSSWLTPVLGEFIEHYPDVQVDLVLEDRELDLSMREADVAIRMQPPRQPELIQRHLMTVHLGCYASPTYIKRHGIPKTPDELDQHRIIVYGEDTTKPPVQNIDWLLRAGTKKDHQRKPILRVNSTYAILRAV